MKEANSKKIILSLCDYSGNWPSFYKKAGYDVRTVDIKRGYDVRLYIPPKNVYGVLAAPPCTCFAVSGNRWKRSKEQYLEALGIVDACLRIVMVSKPNFWALENPVGTLHKWIGKPTMYFQPCDYGDPYTKKTCLWGSFNPPLKNPVKPTEGSKLWKNYGGRSEKTKTMRSLTPLGFAQAFFKANQ